MRFQTWQIAAIVVAVIVVVAIAVLLPLLLCRKCATCAQCGTQEELLKRMDSSKKSGLPFTRTCANGGVGLNQALNPSSDEQVFQHLLNSRTDREKVRNEISNIKMKLLASHGLTNVNADCVCPPGHNGPNCR